MAGTFGTYPLLAPEEERSNALLLGFPLAPWYDKTNSYRNPLGGRSGRGWILLLRSDLDKLGIDTKADLLFSGDQNKASLTLKSLHAVKAAVICPGQRADSDGACWVEIADRRRLLRAIPINKAYNLRDAPGSATYYSATLNTGVAWTWTQLVSDIWTTVGVSATRLGAYPGLPFTPDGTPEGFEFYGHPSALLALDAVLTRIGCALKLDLLTDAFSIVRVQTTDAAATAALALRDAERIWDAEPQVPTRGCLPQYVRVLFSKQRDDTDTTGGSPFYLVDVADSTTPATVEAGTYAVIHDDMPAIYAAGVLQNATALATRAAERAADWFRIAKQTRVLRTYTGLWADAGLRPGAQLQVEVFEERGDDQLGFRTSILSTDGEFDPKTGEVSGGLASAVWEEDADCPPESFRLLEWLAYFPDYLAKSQMSITSDASGFKLVNDEASPSASKYYGTDAAGLLGYHALGTITTPTTFTDTTVAFVNTDVTVDSASSWVFNCTPVFNLGLTVNVGPVVFNVGIFANYYRNDTAFVTWAVDQNNYALPDVGKLIVKVNNVAGVVLSGIANGANGRSLRISVHEDSTGPLLLEHEGAGSTAVNRLIVPSATTVNLFPKEGCSLDYDTASPTSRWRYADDATDPYTGSAYIDVTGLTISLKAHATTHEAGGTDPIPLDTLASPTDITTLNASTTAHGLLRKLSNVSTEYMSGTGAWSTPAGTVYTGTNPIDVTGTVISVRDATATQAGVVTTTTQQFGGAKTFTLTNATTNAADTVLTIGHLSSGTPAAGFGTTVKVQAADDGGTLQDLFTVGASWSTVTHGTQKGLVTLSVCDTLPREVMQFAASGTVGKIGVFGTAAVAQQSGDIVAALQAYGWVSGATVAGASVTGTVPTATAANTVSTANEATDTTCFLLFVTASGTQTLQPKNNAGLTYNSNTNAVGATTFVGALTGNATTATSATTASTLSPGRTINGVAFDGSTNITVTAAAGTLTGTTLNSTVVTSSLTSVGTLISLAVTATVTDTNLIKLNNATTNGLDDAVVSFGHNSTGTAAAGFGFKVNHLLESSTTADTLAGQDEISWVVATHASRKARRKLYVHDTVARECLCLEATGTAAAIGFLGAAATAAQASPDLGSDYATRGLATGTPTFAAANLTGYATQADQETGTSTTTVVSPGRQHFHQSAAKAWAYWTKSGTTITVQRSYNVSSITRNAVGDDTVNFTTSFSDTNYAWAGGGNIPGTSSGVRDESTATPRATGSLRTVTIIPTTGVGTEATSNSIIVFGDL